MDCHKNIRLNNSELDQVFQCLQIGDLDNPSTSRHTQSTSEQVYHENSYPNLDHYTSEAMNKILCDDELSNFLEQNLFLQPPRENDAYISDNNTNFSFQTQEQVFPTHLPQSMAESTILQSPPDTYSVKPKKVKIKSNKNKQNSTLTMLPNNLNQNYEKKYQDSISFFNSNYFKPTESEIFGTNENATSYCPPLLNNSQGGGELLLNYSEYTPQFHMTETSSCAINNSDLQKSTIKNLPYDGTFSVLPQKPTAVFSHSSDNLCDPLNLTENNSTGSRKKKEVKYKVHRESNEFYNKMTLEEKQERKKEKARVRAQNYRQRQHQAVTEIVKELSELRTNRSRLTIKFNELFNLKVQLLNFLYTQGKISQDTMQKYLNSVQK